ncbi:MAG: TadE/TadG family type IV pilus assembly protein [Planctomycetaceae bacterium]
MKTSRYRKGETRRGGATLVETAVVMPVFLIFVWAIIEFGHAFMVVNLLNAAAKRASREGVVDGVTSAQVVARVNEIVGSAVSTEDLTVLVKNGSAFDDPEVNASGIQYATLPDIELEDAEPRQLFIVYVEIPYSAISIMPPKWVTNVTLRGQSAQRHE